MAALDGTVPFLQEEEKQALMRKAHHSLIWASSWYSELSLFQYIQKFSNDPSEDVQDQKAYIMSMVQILLSTSRISPSIITRYYTSAEDPVVQTINQELLDRQNRLRMALWVYASIAIGKLPAWSNFWQTLESRWPFFAKDCMKDFQISLASFDENIAKSQAYFDGCMNRLKEYTSVVSNHQEHDDSDDDSDDDVIFMDAEMYEFHKLLLSKNMDSVLATMDKQISVGVLIVQSEEQRRDASIRMFFLLVSIDWNASVPTSQHREPADQLDPLYLNFFELISARLGQVELYNQFVGILEKIGVNHDDSFERAIEMVYLQVQNCTCSEKSQASKTILQIQSNLRSGKRWKELNDLLGAEVVLAMNPLLSTTKDAVIQLDISRAVETGKDDEFARLKHILTTRCAWIRETCSVLKGLVQMLTELKEANQHEAKTLLNAIEQRITAAFGDRSVIDQGIEKQMLTPDQHPLISVVLQCLSPKAEANDESKNVAWQDFFNGVHQHLTGSPFTTKELTDEDIYSHTKGILYQATDEFLAKGQDKTGHMKLWIRRAIDLIMDATAPRTDGVKADLEDLLRAAEDCSEAISFAFQ
ncbi:hypothetical protein VE03_07188 [Pseudogymnoascus sp. 23342-1-I1]|nr:hypothetical protein VE03_07188 [Pseudogymnoascus sp. 23342-1-I1]